MDYRLAQPYDKYKCTDIISEDLSLFPGLTPDDLKDQMEKAITKKELIIAREDGEICGLVMFSRENRELLYFEVIPEQRGKGIAHNLFKFMRNLLSGSEDIKVKTFRQEDQKGKLAVEYYKKLGFIPGKLTYRNNYPCQEYIYKVKNPHD